MPTPLLSAIFLSCLFVLLPILIKRRDHASKAKPSIAAPKPPGPTRFPLIGSLLSMPSPTGKEAQWMVYKGWQEEYGDLIYLEAVGQKLLILNSLSAIDTLLNKRATNYSDRVQTPIIDMIRPRWSFAFQDYDSRWRDHRRTFHQFFNPSQIHRVHPVIEQEAHAFLKSVVEDAKGWEENLRFFFGSTIIRISYGVTSHSTSSSKTTHNSEYARALVRDSDALITQQALAFQPGRYLVGFMPWLRYVPGWFPGAGWKAQLESIAKLSDRVVSGPFEQVKMLLREGKQSDLETLMATPNVATELIEGLPDPSDESYAYKEEIARNVSGVSYLAGADTTFTSGRAMILALAMHPDVQRKAQAQIDGELGGGGIPIRLPDCKDLERLPYISAIVKEVGRWHTVLPLGVPHVARDDDVYEGYHIPAGTAIFPNTWAVMHDPSVFDEPMQFKPERYLDENGRIDPTVLGPDDAAFGYGRRICPGRFLSHESLSLVLASLLACFDIVPAKDEKGDPKPLRLEVTPSSISVPMPFDVVLVPRSEKHVDLIRLL